MKIKRALLSVSDKRGIVDLAKFLHRYGVEIISTGGTRKVLKNEGLPVTEISSITGNPEAFGGRMKTLSFQVESALLFDREKDADEARRLGIEPIDLVVCNLYPFQKVLEEGGDLETLIENIDIGGPTMIRSAAKNYKYVTVITSPDEYEIFKEEFETNKGKTSLLFRKEMMARAFNHTADYDSLIAQTMDAETGKKSVRMAFTEGKKLRYGENSHQEAYFYRLKDIPGSLHGLKFLHGKELSYNNILDLTGAMYAVRELTGEGCAVVKHSNPCGLAEGENQRKVLERAWQGDPVSAFGSIIAFNKPVQEETVKFFALDHPDRNRRKFIEVVVAPSFSPDALAYLQKHKNLRIVAYDPARLPVAPDYRFVPGALLEQTPDDKLFSVLETVTGNSAHISGSLIEFGLKAVKHIKSNAIAIVGEKDGYRFLAGMGAGQPNRLVATELALKKTREFIRQEWEKENPTEDFEVFYRKKIKEMLLVSDAFFPFPDNVELAAAHGIQNIVQPGGSIRDNRVIEEARKRGINMIFTGMRHFKH